MGVKMSTMMGYVAVLSLFGAYFFREWNRNRQATLARTEAQRLRQERQTINARRETKEARPKENRAKRARADGAAQAAPALATATGTKKAQSYSFSSDDDTVSNREFARQLSNVKQGTKFTGKAKEDTRQKSVKQSRAEELPTAVASGHVSVPSSTDGIDADDDRSSVASPVLAAIEAGNVSDMLEKPAPGPSVLRLTGTEDKTSDKSKKSKAASEPLETKKQRQNRKKVELAKVEREEAEKERKVKQEAQRRLARQAEGRAAKDGSAFIAAQAKQSNAWTGSSSVNGSTAAAPASGANDFIPSQPLDTFDSNAVQTDASKSSAPSYDKGEDWMSSLPSEEEQMELLRSEDSWSTVKTKNRKKNKKENQDSVPADEPTNAPSAPATAPVAVSKTMNDRSRPAIATQSSFAALTVDGAAENEEQEWDV